MACDAAHLHVRLRFRSSLRVAHIRTTYSMSEKTSASSYKNAHERTNTFMSIAISLLRKELQLKDLSNFVRHTCYTCTHSIKCHECTRVYATLLYDEQPQPQPQPEECCCELSCLCSSSVSKFDTILVSLLVHAGCGRKIWNSNSAIKSPATNVHTLTLPNTISSHI